MSLAYFLQLLQGNLCKAQLFTAYFYLRTMSIYIYIVSIISPSIYISMYRTITIYFVTTFYLGETESFVPIACRLLEENAKF